VPPHHRSPPPLITSAPVNHGSRQSSTDFYNKIGHQLPRRSQTAASALDAVDGSSTGT
jgi:hypothetical protein